MPLSSLICTCYPHLSAHLPPVSLQVLNIPTKINKGTVEITSNVALIKAGEKVGASEATLLAKLGIKPFSYGLIVQHVSSPTLPAAAHMNVLEFLDQLVVSSVEHIFLGLLQQSVL